MEKNIGQKKRNTFSEEYLLKRPLLKSITCKDKASVLLIDVIDRADEEFEAYLLEVLSVFQISIPSIDINAKKREEVATSILAEIIQIKNNSSGAAEFTEMSAVW